MGVVDLRDYQAECLNVILERYRAGVRRQLICLPTGTGKTVIFAQFPSYFRMRKRMLVLAHREELLDQARDKIMRANPDLRTEIEQADRRAGPQSDVVVASVPTLGREGGRRIQSLDPNEFFLVVVDEAHHATAPTYRRVLSYFGVLDPQTPKLLVGFTATPKRGDGQGLDAVFQEIAFARSLPEMIEAGFLAPLAAYRVETDVDLSGVKTRMGDFVAAQLSRAVNTAPRNELVVDVYRNRLNGRPTLCFCVDVDHAHGLADTFLAAGIATAAITGGTEREERARIIGRFKAGELSVLTNCMVLTEGFDESSISGIILARPTKSALLYTQMIGRGTRLHPRKENVTVIDIVDASRAHRLVTLPSLFGLPSDFDLEGRTTAEAERARAWVEAKRPWVRTDLAASFSDLRYRCQRIDLLDLETPEEIALCSDYAWVSAGRHGYRLGLSRGEVLLVAPTILGNWEVIRRDQGHSETILMAPDHFRAIRQADRFVAEQRPDAVKLVDSQSRWRDQPASEKQIRFLQERKISAPRELKKGQASHLIGMLAAG